MRSRNKQQYAKITLSSTFVNLELEVPHSQLPSVINFELHKKSVLQKANDLYVRKTHAR
jgi:hypothetical protein